MAVPSLSFNNGKTIPILGFGTWKSKPGEVVQAVKDAIDVGYRHIDCAMVYGNEPEVGQAIKSKIDDGTVKREDLFVTSKLWNTFHSKHHVITQIKKTLGCLGLDYLDLYLIHWPMGYKEDVELFPNDANGKMQYSDVDYLDTWGAMEECVDLGLTKSVGVSNFNSAQIERILASCRVKPVMNQVECNPQVSQKKLISFCKSKNIVVTAYSPLGSPDRPWAKPDDAVLMDDPKLAVLAKKHGKAPAQILIKFQVQRGVVCIPKSVTKSRIEANFKIFDFCLSDEDMKELDTFDSGFRICGLEWIKDHPYWPFSIEF